MTREGTRPFAAIVAVVLAAALLAACGSSDSSGTTGASTSDSTTSAQAGDGQGRQDDSQGKSASKGDSRDQKSSPGDKQDGGSSHPQNVETPLQVSGGGSTQFRTKGGDNSVQDFGEEGESELQEVAEVVHDFYVTRAEEKWDAACSYLAKANVKQLEQLVAESTEIKGGGCGTALKAFTRPLPASVQREISTVDAGSFRREGDQGFLIYFGAGHVVYAMPLREEGGAWKVTALSGTTLN